MLQKLAIRNYALIDSLEMDFQQGLTVMTGETGAGKSVILGALSLILGQRADAKSMKDVSSKTVVEGTFDISRYALQTYFADNDFDYEPHCIIRREILPSGKSRSFINDTPASLAQLRELGEQLIDIHSQHQNLLLSDNHFQLRVIDLWASEKDLSARYREAYLRYRELAKELDEARRLCAESRKEEEYLRFQYNQLCEAALQAGEQIRLEETLETLTHAEEIKNALFSATRVLDGDDMGVMVCLKDTLSQLRPIQQVYPAVVPLIERLESTLIELKDIHAELDDRQERTSVDPERLQQVETRLDLIYSLLQKHRLNTAEELIALRDDLEMQLADIDNSDTKIKEMEEALQALKSQVLDLGQKLSHSRHQCSAVFTERLIERAAPLGMPHLRFEVEWTSKDHFDIEGLETVRFLFSANKNRPLQPVAEVASGGEISRLMLAIKSLAADVTALPTIIFDEIDTGVSGEIADKMGTIMADMARNMQVVAITHLPQVASRGTCHYRIYKDDAGETSRTCIEWLDMGGRRQEVARMLSGSQLTEAALINASELLNRK